MQYHLAANDNIRFGNLDLALKDGRIIEQGTHQELMKKNGYYARLFEKQAECFRNP